MLAASREDLSGRSVRPTRRPAPAKARAAGPPRGALGFYGYRVRDVMTRPVITTTPGASLADAASRMSRKSISGLPVLGPSGRLVGVISQKDLLRLLTDRAGLRVPGSVLDLVLAPSRAGRSGLAEACNQLLEDGRVRDIMSRPARWIAPEASLDDAVRVMVAGRINRLPVLSDGRLVGIVTRSDLLSGISSTASP